MATVAPSEARQRPGAAAKNAAAAANGVNGSGGARSSNGGGGVGAAASAQAPWVPEWAVQALAVAVGAWQWFAGSSVGQWVWRLSAMQYVWATLVVTHGVFLQRLHMRHLHELDAVGGPAKGLVAIVTGPTSGIGSETAAALARRGATVILACRSAQRGQALKARIEAQVAGLGHEEHPHLEVWTLDLASLATVRAFVDKWEAGRRELHILINNAGIYSMNAPREETSDGFEAHIGSNHLGHFLLTLGLLPALRRGSEARGGAPSRVVTVASDMHLYATRGLRVSDPHFRLPKSYTSQAAYAQSKLANILFTRELRHRLLNSGGGGGGGGSIEALVVHPGMVLTNVVRTLPHFVTEAYKLIMGLILLTPSEGARASVYAATDGAAAAEAAATDGYLNSNCRPVATSPSADDRDQAAWLWRWSAEQVTLPANLDLPKQA